MWLLRDIVLMNALLHLHLYQTVKWLSWMCFAKAERSLIGLWQMLHMLDVVFCRCSVLKCCDQ